MNKGNEKNTFEFYKEEVGRWTIKVCGVKGAYSALVKKKLGALFDN